MRHLERRNTVCGESARVEDNAYLAPCSADQGYGRNVRNLFNGVVKLRGDPPELEITISTAGQRQCQDWHIVDRTRLDERLRSAGRNQVVIGQQFLVKPNDALLFILTDKETNNRHRAAGTRRRINVFDTRELP